MVKTFWENLEIRDTNLKKSDIIQVDLYQLKLIVLHNTLDTSVDIKVFGKLWLDHPLEILIENSVVTIEPDGVLYFQIADYFPYLFVTAQCSTSPTIGSLSVYVAGMPENKVER